MREQFDITFQKIAGPSGHYFYDADSSVEENLEICRHLVGSDESRTRGQIKQLQHALDGKTVEEHREIAGSDLFIFTSNLTVKVGYRDDSITVSDFKQLLEEWLAFLQT